MHELGRNLVNVICRPLEGSEGALFVVSEPASASAPANGGLRILPYRSDAEAVADGYRLCARMRDKHRLYGTGFAGAKLVARAHPGRSKKAVLQTTADALRDLAGTVYTGCDLNVSTDDAERLADLGGYVLAALGSPVDPSIATGRGVAASVLSALSVFEQHGTHLGKRILVHGAGATGSVVAQRLATSGLSVSVLDAVPERANLPGCTNVSGESEWWKIPHDVLLLCSGSGILTKVMAQSLPARLIVSAANAPFENDAVGVCLAERGVAWVCDAVSNAGAVIVDAIEFHRSVDFRRSEPESIYRYVEALVASATALQLLDTAHPDAVGAWTPFDGHGGGAGERFSVWQSTGQFASGASNPTQEAAG